ncbi:Uma2 family endonuclease [Streptomyces zhihengii]|uniref:Uma2 family endonuclease n=1 Tax=Streptomyces zhihengii TaxID=1818004 RepID=A0ABS2UTF7_9ACTN|nr:Uma2 family endonuclease [Streptomyces zhihengii]MBM9620708.1 Uma2 family endonuclease [Streptomyces zhihengii]
MTPRRGPLARLVPRDPRGVARLVTRATGLRAEVLGGSLVLTRTDCAVRTETVRLLADRIAGGGEWEAVGGCPVDMPLDADDFAVPDLLVRKAGAGGRPVLAVEVVSRAEKGRGLSGKAEWYAAAYLPLLLVVDPREGRWSLCSGPDGAAFTRTGQGVYGEAAVLPAPFAGAVPTAGLPVH